MTALRRSLQRIISTLALSLLAGSASAQDMTLSASTLEITPGVPFSVTADLTGLSEVGDYDLGVSYNPAELSFVSAEQLSTTEVSTGVFERAAFDVANVSAGSGDLVVVLPGNDVLLLTTPPNSPQPPPGSETGLFQLTFQPIVAPPTTSISVGELGPQNGIIGTDGQIVELGVSVATVTVPEPAGPLQAFAALAALGLVGCSRRGRPASPAHT